MSEPTSLRPAPGFVEPDVRDEFPGLRLDWVTVQARRRPSPRSLVRSLEQVSNRYRGATVVTMRTKPIPQAYRTFYRQIGLDPDVTRIPSEAAALGRLLHGKFRSADAIVDTCLLALIETGVPVWALDADRVDEGGLGISTTTVQDAERAKQEDRYIDAGTLAVADRSTPHALLFAEPDPGHGVGAETERVALYAVGVDGVPAIHLEEALWICIEQLDA